MKISLIPEFSNVILLTSDRDNECECNALLHKVATANKCLIVDAVSQITPNDDLSGVDFILTTDVDVDCSLGIPIIYVGE